MHSIDIFFTSFKKPLEQDLFTNYLSLLPIDLREKNARFVRWQDKHAHLLGKLLLKEAFKSYKIEDNIWDFMAYTKYKRPYLTLDGYDFNISHSGNFVVCAIGKNVRLGIDIEENRNRNVNDFRYMMTPDQWKEINNANCSIKTFYKYWTIKESMIKADGRGFFIPLDELEVKSNTINFENKLWFVNNFMFAKGYSAALTTNKLSKLKMHELNFYPSLSH